jgi:outer membrane usher protein
LPRTGFGTDTDAYLGKEVGSATLRKGIHDWLTVEAHAEAGAGTANAGVGAVVRTGGFGLASLAIAGSRTGPAHGFQPYASFETRVGVLTFSASSQATFGKYDDLAAATGRIQNSGFFYRTRKWDVLQLVIPTWGASAYSFSSYAPPKTLNRLSLGAPLPLNLGSVSFSYIGASSFAGDRSRIITATYSRILPYSANFNASAFVDFGNHRSAGVWAGLSVPLGGSASASVGMSRTRDGSALAADLSQPLGAEPGSVGWRLSGVEGKPAAQLAAASYRSSYGWGEVTAAHANGRGGATAQIDGSLATMGSGLFFGNRIDDAFAVVETGVPGVDVAYENRPVGTTNQSGRLLVPALRSYQSNKISIDTTRLPVDADVSTTEEYVVPAYRSGVRLDFAVRTNTNAAVLVLRSADGSPIPTGAHGVLRESSQSFIIGYDGRAYVHGLAPENTLLVETTQGRCEASFIYKARANEQVSIPITCRY